MSLHVRFLGSGDSFGSGGRHQTCILVDTGRTRLLLDCGASAMIAMRAQGIEPNSIDAILISHLHGDHCAGVPFVVIDGMLASKRDRPLVVAGPEGARERLDAMREVLFPGSGAMRPRFDYRVIELPLGEPTRLADLAIIPRRARHTPQTSPTMLRVEAADRVVAFTGDTDWTDEIVPLAAGADLLICECYAYRKPIPAHMTYAKLAANLHRLDARRIVLTHLSGEMLAHAGEVKEVCAYDGMTLEV